VSVAVSRIVIGKLRGGRCSNAVRMSAVSFCWAKGLKEGDWNQATCVGQGRVASLIPLGVILAADDVEEVAS
jgi:hypothetical protein